MRKSLAQLMLVSWLLIVSNSHTIAQINPIPNCPSGKLCTVFVVMNGVMVSNETGWIDTVTQIKGNFLDYNHNRDPNHVIEFVPIHNNSFGVFDFVQAYDQWFLQGVNAISFLRNYRFSLDYLDPDFRKIINTAQAWSSKGYKVVLVGHSQGSFYTSAAYDYLTSVPPDSRKLAVINIASAASYVNNGIIRYVTQCGDVILNVPNSLPPNINPLLNIPQCANYSVSEQIRLHKLANYTIDGSKTLKRIHDYFEDSLPNVGCGTDPNCYLKDNFSSGEYTDNFTNVDYGIVDSGDSIVTSNGGVLRLISKPYSFTSWARLTLNTRRFFVGNFTASLEYNSYGSGVNDIMLVNAKDNSVAAHWALAPTSSNNQWHSLVFTKTNSWIAMYINGIAQDGVYTTPTSGYYLSFDSRSSSTLQIRNLSVTRGATAPPPPAPTLIATCSADPTVITAGQSATFTGSSTGGTGVRRGSWSGVVSGSGSTATYRTSTSTAAGLGKATYTVTDSGSPKQTATATCQVEIKAAVQKGTIVITTNGTVPSVNCKLNGTSVTGPGVFGNQSVGSKTLSCTPPNGFTLTSITPSETQMLTAGGEISFKVNLTATVQKPVLDSLAVNTEPKVNTNINVSLFGSGFVRGTSKGYVCTSSSTSSCSSTSTVFVDDNELTLTKVRSSTARRLYIRVKNSDYLSNYKTMVVIK